MSDKYWKSSHRLSVPYYTKIAGVRALGSILQGSEKRARNLSEGLSLKIFKILHPAGIAHLQQITSSC